MHNAEGRCSDLDPAPTLYLLLAKSNTAHDAQGVNFNFSVIELTGN